MAILDFTLSKNLLPYHGVAYGCKAWLRSFDNILLLKMKTIRADTIFIYSWKSRRDKPDTSLYKRVFSTESLWCKNQNNHNSQSEQRKIKRGTNENSKKLTSEPPKTQENASVQVAIGLFWFFLVGNWCESFGTIRSEVKQNQRNPELRWTLNWKVVLSVRFSANWFWEQTNLHSQPIYKCATAGKEIGIGDWFLGVLDKRESLLSLRICSELLPILEMKIA